MKRLLYIIAGLVIGYSTMAAQNMWSVQYSVALPHGDSQAFTENISGRGISVEGKSFISNNVAVGGFMGWNVFTDDIADGSVMIGDVAVYGHEYRYLNAMPIMGAVSYYPSNGQGKIINPYGSIGMGLIFQEQLIEMGTKSIYNDGWMFGLAPEVGVSVDLPGEFEIIINYKYIFGFETSQVDQLSYSNLNIGIGVSF